jgi:hypothetical protein
MLSFLGDWLEGHNAELLAPRSDVSSAPPATTSPNSKPTSTASRSSSAVMAMAPRTRPALTRHRRN